MQLACAQGIQGFTDKTFARGAEWNVAGAFERRLPRELPRRGTVFVVDDVFTTGATTSSCISAFGRDFPLDTKVCTLLYDEPVTATMDFVADCKMEWNV